MVVSSSRSAAAWAKSCPPTAARSSGLRRARPRAQLRQSGPSPQTSAAPAERRAPTPETWRWARDGRRRRERERGGEREQRGEPQNCDRQVIECLLKRPSSASEVDRRRGELERADVGDAALAVPADLAEASASLSRRTRAAAAGGSYDLAVVRAVGAAAVGAALAGVAQLTASNKISDITTARARPPAGIARVRGRRARRAVRVGPELGGARRATIVARKRHRQHRRARRRPRRRRRALRADRRVLARRVRDHRCARARVRRRRRRFSLQLVERARLALLSSEALAAAGCIFDAECDAGWRLPLAALKLVLYAAATADSETHAYFLGAQLELAWALLERPPPPPPPPPRRGWPGALRRWWRARTGRCRPGKQEI